MPMDQQQKPPQPTRLPRRPAHRVWSWPVVGVLLVTAGALLHLSYLLPHFLPQFFDPAVPAVRLLHGASGIVAMVTALVQLWPGLRRRWPHVHRWNGRVYVFAGVLPSTTMLVGLLFAIGEPTTTADFFWGMAWLTVTAIAWRAARRGQFAKHRQWMSYSVALTLVVSTNAGLYVLAPHLAPLVSPAVVHDSLDWLTWVLHLAVAHWLVVRGRSVVRAGQGSAAGAQVLPFPGPGAPRGSGRNVLAGQRIQRTTEDAA
jgi:uncharacterized membrane protein